MRGFVGMDLIMIILNEKTMVIVVFYFYFFSYNFLVWNYMVSIIKI